MLVADRPQDGPDPAPSFFRELRAGERVLPLLAALRSMDAEMGYHVLAALHDAEDEQLRAGFGGRRRERVRAAFAASPIFEGSDIDVAVEAYAAYRSNCKLTELFAALFVDQLRPLCQFEGLEDLQARRTSGEKVVLVPFHVRHWGALMSVVVGLGHPLTLMVAPGNEHKAAMFRPQYDVDALTPTDLRILRQCRAALGSGRLLLWSPDIYNGLGHPDAEATFLDRPLPMSRALPAFCRRERAVSVPCHVTSTGRSPAMRVVFGPPFDPPKDEAGDRDYLQALCDHYGATLHADGDEVAWMGWDPPARVAVESRRLGPLG